MEIWDVTDRDGRVLGRCERGSELPAGRYHGIVDIWVQNAAGKLLVTQRAKEKTYGLFWENTAGSLLSGEDFPEAAVRELAEETGLSVAISELELLERRVERRSIWHSYFVKTNIAEDAVRLQSGETVDYRWVTRTELDDMMNRGELASPVVYRYQRVKTQLTERGNDA